MAYVWQWFCEVVGPEALTYAELQAWAAMTGTKLASWEAELLRSLDRIFRKVQHER